MFYYKILWKSTCIYTHWLGYMLSKTSVLPYQRWLNGHFLKTDIITYLCNIPWIKRFLQKKLLPRNVWSESCKCLLTWIWPQWTTMFLFLLYSCFLLFILWGSVLKKIIMLANSYIHKKDISIVYVYHVNLVKLYTIYHRKMMLLFFFLCIHIKGLVFLLANMVNYWMCCWWLILLSHVIDMVTFVMVTKWCQRTRRPRIVGSMAQKGDCGRESQSKKSSSFSDDSLGIPNINKAKKYGLNEVIPVDVLDYSTFASSTCTVNAV